MGGHQEGTACTRKAQLVGERGAYTGPEPAVVAAVADLLPVFRQRAQEAEDNRVVSAESVKALAETGFFRLLQPASHGGLEADPIAFFTAVRLIASACGSTGWGGAGRPRVARALSGAAAPGGGGGGGVGVRPPGGGGFFPLVTRRPGGRTRS